MNDNINIDLQINRKVTQSIIGSISEENRKRCQQPNPQYLDFTIIVLRNQLLIFDMLELLIKNQSLTDYEYTGNYSGPCDE